MKNPTRSRELSAIHPEGFDYLAAVLFDIDYGVLRAAVIPRKVVKDRLTAKKQTFTLSDKIWGVGGVVDATMKLRQALAEL